MTELTLSIMFQSLCSKHNKKLLGTNKQKKKCDPEWRGKLVKRNRLTDDEDFEIRWEGFKNDYEKYAKGPT